jgi:sortase (surface protein transpeptidase)
MAMLLGALLVVGAPAAWLAAGAPGGPTSVFGETTVVEAAESVDTPLAGPLDDPTEAPTEQRTAPASDVPVVAEPSPFTTTAPRGAIDRTLWPASLAIPALDVTAPVQAVGVSTGGELIIPPSPMDVGWYQGGSVPGEPGVALLTSHIDTRTEGRGVLAGLVQLAEGDEVLVTAADGSVQRWAVSARTQHRKDQLPTELFARAGSPILALVTCGGPFNTSTRSYRDNVIVWARPIVD